MCRSTASYDSIDVKAANDEAEATVEVVVQGVPEPPMNINVQNVGKNVEVTFEPGFNNYATIIKYLIEFAEIEEGGKTLGSWNAIKEENHKGGDMKKQRIQISGNEDYTMKIIFR